METNSSNILIYRPGSVIITNCDDRLFPGISSQFVMRYYINRYFLNPILSLSSHFLFAALSSSKFSITSIYLI